ncbi:MAG: hypothetical protein ACXVKA_08965 [Acidimicrobiia bacterium]
MTRERDAAVDDAATVDELRCLLAAEKIRNRLLTLRKADLAAEVEIIAREVEDLYRYFGAVPRRRPRSDPTSQDVESSDG